MSRPNISYPTPIPPSPSFQQPNMSQSGSMNFNPSQNGRAGPSSVEHSRIASSSGRTPTGALDSSITRLLVTTKQMLQSLDQWCQGTIDEEGVSDIYVKLGNGFEMCVNAFQEAGISTDELNSIPQDLRVCLEQCLAEDPSQETLNMYLPHIRTIIYSLLTGLKQKQAQYKRIMQNRSPETPVNQISHISPSPSHHQYPQASSQQSLSNQANTQGQGQNQNQPGTSLYLTQSQSSQSLPRDDRSESRLSARSHASFGSAGASSPVTLNSPLPQAHSNPSLAGRARVSPSPRPAPPDAFRPPRMRPPEGPSKQRSVSPQSQSTSRNGPSTPPIPLQNTENAGASVIRHQLSDPPVGSTSSPPTKPTALPPQRTGPTPPPKSTPPPRPDRFSRDSYGNPRAISRFSADSDITNNSPIKSSPRRGTGASSPSRQLSTLSENAPTTEESATSSSIAAPTTQSPSSLPPSLPTLNLPSSIHLSDPPPIEATPQLPEVTPESRATLFALSRSDALERRASKRFSSYTFNKLPGSPTQKKGSSLASPTQRPARRMEKAPPMPALPESMASQNLGVTSDGRKTPSSQGSSSRLGPPNGHHGASSSDDHSHSRSSHSPKSLHTDPSGTSDEGSVRSFKTPDPMEASPGMTPRVADFPAMSTMQYPTRDQDEANPTNLTVFLQVGRQVKKAVLELPVSLSALRLMFMERFEYDPGMEDFPDVYMRDNRTGVQFELEDVEDLREGCLLSLNIEPLDQVKQHFDLTFATMMQEFKEMKHSIEQSKRMSTAPTSNFLALSPSNLTARALPSGNMRSPDPQRPVSPSPRPAAVSRGSMSNIDRTAELQAHQDEVQNLRRDLAVMRQLHVDFFSETKDALTKLKKENTGMRDMVKTKMGGSRALLDNSKAKLETLCADTIQAVEEISDTIDNAREDATRRFVTPSKNQMATIRADLQKASEMVDAFAKEVSTVEPTWRATWHQELSRVMDEQRLLPHQSKLTVDLKSDIKAAETVLGNLQDFIDQKAASGVQGRNTSRGFRPPTPDQDGGGITNLLMEIRTKESDPNSRLKAIEAQQKAREKEKASKTDEFEQELSGFVKGKKLRKTGGTEETERKSQRRQDQTLKRMLTGESGTGAGTGSGGGGLGSPTSGIITPQLTGRSGGMLSPTTPSEEGGGLGSRSSQGDLDKV